MHKPESVLENEMHIILSEFEIETDHPNPNLKKKILFINKKKRTCLVVFAFPVDHKMKIKES